MPDTALKLTLRRKLRRRRRDLDPEDRTRWSAALAQVVLHTATWSNARSIAAFVGVRGEPDTQPLLRAALDGRRSLWLPRLRDERRLTEFVEVHDLDADLGPGPFGLIEPLHRPGQRTLPVVDATTELDLILIPGLAFDSCGTRLGLGMGHYDRLLAPVANHPMPQRMGVCFAAFLDPSEEPLPREPHDIPMHHIATEQGIVTPP